PRRLLLAPVVLVLALALAAARCDSAGDGASADDPMAGARTTSAPLVVASLPTADAVRALYATEAKTPEGAMKVWLTAALMTASPNLDEHRRGRALLGELTLQLQGDPTPWWERNSQTTFADRLNHNAYIFRSYAEGATPDNGYAMDGDAWTLAVDSSREDDFDRGWRLAVVSGGADSPRPVYLKQVGELWYVNEFANVYLDIRPAK
ncbi:MAG: hypothetical protein KC635_29910, partial [Myxococcales bacterium]|nr:hypothetical protein [Myxococcales bacterium]